MANAVLIKSNDNVVTVIEDIQKGNTVTAPGESVQVEVEATEDVSFGHKIAIQDIKQGDVVIKYGRSIGIATRDIQKGNWVHLHNLTSDYQPHY